MTKRHCTNNEQPLFSLRRAQLAGAGLRSVKVVAAAALVASLAGAIVFSVAPTPSRVRSLASALFHDVRRAVTSDDRSLMATDDVVQCWGDSLTSGYGASFRHDYPTVLERFYQRKAHNFGIPKETSTQIKDRFIARKNQDAAETVVIWAGRNDSWLPDQVISNIAAMVASMGPEDRYIVLGVTTSDSPTEYVGGKDYAHIQTINETLRKTYGERFLPINDILISKANLRFEQDRISVARGTLPRSLRSDRLHMNDAGTLEVAVAVNDKLTKLGW